MLSVKTPELLYVHNSDIVLKSYLCSYPSLHFRLNAGSVVRAYSYLNEVWDIIVES